MKHKKKFRSSEGGYTLIELVVTILISSVVVLAVTGFLTTGLKHYRNINAETMLQMEAQVADLFVTELFQEAQDFRVIDSSAYPAGITYAVEVKRGDTYILALNGGELWFSKVTGSTDAEKLTELKSAGRAKAFLAKHVNSFGISGNTTFSDTVNNGKGLVHISVEFVVDSKTYDDNMLIALRNAKRN